jgi:TonB family protein
VNRYPISTLVNDDTELEIRNGANQMKNSNMRILLSLVLVLSFSASISNAQNGSGVSDTKQEITGSVDRLVKELRDKDETVVDRCLENCDQKNADNGKGGEILDKISPDYPPIARAAHASGDVVVRVLIDEEGKVIAAQSTSGHPLLQAAGVKAARMSTFTPFVFDGKAVKVVGDITYRFVLD